MHSSLPAFTTITITVCSQCPLLLQIRLGRRMLGAEGKVVYSPGILIVYNKLLRSGECGSHGGTKGQPCCSLLQSCCCDSLLTAPMLEDQEQQMWISVEQQMKNCPVIVYGKYHSCPATYLMRLPLHLINWLQGEL